MIAVDTGYLLALIDKKDPHHRRAIAWMTSQQEGWVTTWPVITEAAYMIGDRLGASQLQEFLQDAMEGVVSIWDIPVDRAKKIPAYIKKYQNLPMDLADASLVLLAEHLGHGRILTTDQRDFGAYRWKATKPFVDLMAKMPV